MASIRKVILATGEVYHIFNRGIEGRTIFTDKREYQRAKDVIGYYRVAGLPMRFSMFVKLPLEEKNKILESLNRKSQSEVKIIAYCFMPNHFHLLLRQEKDGGTSRFVSNFCNSYSKYFNTKNKRQGPLFQGAFKAVRVETDDQLIHLSRYIHLNPTISFVVQEKNLDRYPWSSLYEYLSDVKEKITDSDLVLSSFKNVRNYREFVYDQIAYARELEKIKHLILEE